MSRGGSGVPDRPRIRGRAVTGRYRVRCDYEKEKPVPGKFVIKKGTTGKFRFNLLSTNGQVVATSEAYDSKASAMGGIRAVKKLAAEAAIEDQTTKEWAAAEAAGKAAAPVKKAVKKAVKKVGRKAAAAVPRG